MRERMIIFYRMAYIALAIALIFTGCCRTPTPISKETSSKEKTLRIAINDDPGSLDPRQARDLCSLSIIRLLFDGLTRIDALGNAKPAVADSILISSDHKTYTFHLKHTYWSNGDPLTVHDFIYAWKRVLDPAFPAPNANQLFVIRNAKNAKEGKGSLDDVAISAIDDYTLHVELEHPTPYFLSLVSLPSFFPINANRERQNPLWANQTTSSFVSNGPFLLDHWRQNDQLGLKKNPRYWEASAVGLDGLLFVHQEENTALLLYERGELDWVGSPLSTLPADSIAALRTKGVIQIVPSAGTQFFRFNTLQPPFNHVKMRQAFAYALDRAQIITHILQGNQTPAM